MVSFYIEVVPKEQKGDGGAGGAWFSSVGPGVPKAVVVSIMPRGLYMTK